MGRIGAVTEAGQPASGLLAYPLMWILMPEEPAAALPAPAHPAVPPAAR